MQGVSSAKRRPILGPFVSSSFRRTGVLMAHGDECMQKKSFVSVRFVETFSRKRSGLNSMYSREVDELK